MTHKRKTIRDKTATLLGSLTTTGSNVFASRVYPVESASLPALLIYVGPEEALDDQSSMGNVKVIAAELNLEVRAAKSSGLDDQLDTILEEVQTEVATDRKLSNTLVKRLNYLGIDGPEWSSEGEKEHAVMTIQYQAIYEVTL